MKVRTTPLERIAVGGAVALFIAGFTIGFFGDSVWLNRFGSLIIVLGVLIAAIKISDILTQQITQFMDQTHKEQVKDLVDANKSFFGGSLPAGYQEKLEEAVTKDVHKVFAAYKQRRVDRVKWVEIGVVVFGTLTNGFGDYLLSFFKVAITC